MRYLCHNTSYGNITHTFSMVILGWMLDQYIPVYLTGHTSNASLDTRLIYWAEKRLIFFLSRVSTDFFSLCTHKDWGHIIGKWFHLLSNSIPSIRWSYLSISKLQRSNWSLGMNKQFYPTLDGECDYLSLLGLKLFRIDKSVPSSSSITRHGWSIGIRKYVDFMW